jgi:hypothetical protein
LPDHVGELGRLAGERLAELVPEPLVADCEIAKDLRGDRVVLGAQCEQHVLGRCDRAAMTQPPRFVACGLQDALSARRYAQRRGRAGVSLAEASGRVRCRGLCRDTQALGERLDAEFHEERELV